MHMNEYQQKAMRTANPEKMSTKDALMNAALGLNGEAGEFGDILKKVFFQGHMIDTSALMKELGDVLWYCALAATALGTDLESIARINLQKLSARYPNGFEEERSRDRAESNEG